MKTIGLIGCAATLGVALTVTMLATAGRESEQGPVLERTAGPGTLTPSPRAYHATARRGSTYMFGGNDGTKNLDETWKKRADNRAWYLREVGGPEARQKTGMVFNSTRGTLNMFGGKGADGALYDTWEHRGGSARNKWTLISLTGPAARYDHMMTYDDTNNRVILFGGTDGTDVFGDTWELVFQNGLPVWRQISNSGPPARRGGAMVYDTLRDRAVLFGGTTSAADGPDVLGDTWELIGSTWTWIANSGPSPRSGHSMVMHSSCNMPVLFGGADADGARDDTWFLMNDTDWTLITDTVPPARQGAAMSYDCTQNHTVLNGGLNGALLDDTWTLRISCNIVMEIDDAGREHCTTLLEDAEWELHGPTAQDPTGSGSDSGSKEGSGDSTGDSDSSESKSGCGNCGDRQSPPTARHDTCRGDVDRSLVVDVNDLVGVILAYGRTAGPADVDADGVVGASDVLAVIASWGRCPSFH